jgi:hypothetical protein
MSNVKLGLVRIGSTRMNKVEQIMISTYRYDDNISVMELVPALKYTIRCASSKLIAVINMLSQSRVKDASVHVL